MVISPTCYRILTTIVLLFAGVNTCIFISYIFRGRFKLILFFTEGTSLLYCLHRDCSTTSWFLLIYFLWGACGSQGMADFFLIFFTITIIIIDIFTTYFSFIVFFSVKESTIQFMIHGWFESSVCQRFPHTLFSFTPKCVFAVYSSAVISIASRFRSPFSHRKKARGFGVCWRPGDLTVSTVSFLLCIRPSSQVSSLYFRGGAFFHFLFRLPCLLVCHNVRQSSFFPNRNPIPR